MRLFVALVACLAFSTLAAAQCADWRAGPFQNNNGINGYCIAAVMCDPDGAGPLGQQLVIGGQFYWAGGARVNDIARWDGSAWQPFGAGASGGSSTPEVDALAVYPPGTEFAGQLIAGGNFGSMDGVPAANIARWDGAAWHPVGAGLNRAVFAITFWDPDGPGPAAPQLIAGGVFTGSGGVPASYVARFDGTAWQPLGGGMAGDPMWPDSTGVLTLESWDPDGAGPLPPVLIAGGFFAEAGGVPAHNIASWNGSAWAPLSTGVSGAPAGSNFGPGVVWLAVWDPDGLGAAPPVLVAGGFFFTAGGVTTNNIASWNGSAWSGFSTGMNDGVQCLSVFGGQLVAGGSFTSAGGTPARGAATWTGSAWQPLGGGFDGAVLALTPYVPPGSITTQLFAGGQFDPWPANMHNVASWDGSAWSPFSVPVGNTYVYAMAQFGGDMIAGGSFSTPPGDMNGIQNLARWDGVDLTGIGNTNGMVRALKTFTTGFPGNQTLNMIVGGDFTSAGGVSANRIAIYTQPPMLADGTWSAMGAGFTGLVESVERYSNVIYAGGAFTASGVQPVSHIASWTGSAWQQVGLGVDGSVLAMKAYNGALYVGGSFTHAGSLATGGLARWDGANWTQVGGTFPGTVYSMEVYNGNLVVGGTFSGIAGAVNLVTYNSASNSFSPLPSGGPNQVVRALCVGSDGGLYAAGDFGTIGGILANRVAKWNGLVWSAVPGGADDNVFALCPFHGEVETGGTFTHVGGTIVTAGWARFSADGLPFVVQQPLSAGTMCAAREASFHCQGSDGYALSYQWRHNGAPITLGVATSGTVFTSDGPTLDIANAHGVDTGTYDCVISDACGGVTTIAAPLRVNSADFNGDGALGTDADIEAFFACIAGSCCAACGSADFNADGGVGTDADIESFFRVLGGGPC
jgi:hypothetical protein